MFRLILLNSENVLPLSQKRCVVDLPVELQMVEENNEGSLKEDPVKGEEIGRELDKQKEIEEEGEGLSEQVGEYSISFVLLPQSSLVCRMGQGSLCHDRVD